MTSPAIFKKLLLQARHLKKFYSVISSAAEPQNTHVPPRPFNEIPKPTGIGGLPKIGGLFLLHPFSKYKLENIHELFDKLHDKYGEIVRLEVGMDMVMVANADDIAMIYKYEGKYPRRPKLEIMTEYIKKNKRTPSLVMLEGEEWAELRSQLQKKLVRPNSALHYLESQAEVSNVLVKRLKTVKDSDVRELLFMYATESIGVVCFNKRLGVLDQTMTGESKEYIDNLKIFFTLINEGTIGLPIFKYFPTPMFKKFTKSADLAFGFGREQIGESFEKCAQMKKDGTWDPDEPNLIMSLIAEERLSIDQITSVVLDLLLAGTDSTAKTLEVFLACLARNPEKQEKLHQEIDHLMGRHGNLTSENLRQMIYLRACLKESMRMNYPLIGGIARILPVDVILSGYTVPKGTLIGANNRRLLLQSQYVTNPHEYQPERWLRDESGKKQENIPTVGLIPFSLGPRNCIGRRFAEQEIYLAISKIIQNYKVTFTGEESDSQMIYHAFGSLAKPPMFKFTERD